MVDLIIAYASKKITNFACNLPIPLSALLGQLFLKKLRGKVSTILPRHCMEMHFKSLEIIDIFQWTKNRSIKLIG